MSEPRIEEASISSVGDLMIAATRVYDDFAPNTILYRGQDVAHWGLVTKLDRLNLRDHESNLAVEFNRRAQTRHLGELPQPDDHLNWLALMQHYGLPTRLLDWTMSALVAAFFAVRDAESEHCGSIWVLCPAALNARSAQQPFEGAQLNLDYTQFHPWVTDAFRSRSTQEAPRNVIAGFAHDCDVRMSVQQAAFSVHGIGGGLDDQMLPEHFLRRWDVPRKAKELVRKQLHASGITEAALFPDRICLALERVRLQGSVGI